MKQTLGTRLLQFYFLIGLLIFLVNIFQISSAFFYMSWPSYMLLKYVPKPFFSIMLKLGSDGLVVLCILIQAAILYFGGNALEKILKNKNEL